MADIILELDVDGKPVKGTLKDVEKETARSGKKAGDQFNRNLSRGTSRAFRRIVLSAAAAGAAIVAAFASRAAIRAANVQAQAVNSLNSALFQTGEFTEQTSRELQDFASEIQKVTRFGDEAVIQQLAYSKSLGATVEQSKKLVSASSDLATALGVDLASANQRLTQTLTVQVGSLGRVIPELRGLTEEQLKAGAAIDIVAQKFAGFAERDVDTFEGRVQQLSNNFGDLQETFGFLIINAPGISNAVNALSQGFVRLNKFVEENSKALGSVVSVGLVSLTQGAILSLRAVIGLADGFLRARNAFLAFSNRVAISNLQEELEKLPKGIDINGQEIEGTYARVLRTRIETLKGEGDAERESFEERLQVLGAFRDEIIEVGESVTNALSGGEEGESKSIFAEAFDIGDDVELLKTKTGEAVKVVDVASQQVAAINAALVSGISQSIQLLGKSLVTGEDFFKGFMGVVLNALGDLLIGFGTAAITTGAVAEAIRSSIISLAGGQAIVAGVASIAAGGALKAYAGSFGGASSGPTIASPTGTASGGVIDSDAPLNREDREAVQQIQLVVQGDILDSEQTGTRLLSILNEKFESDNSSLIGARFA